MGAELFSDIILPLNAKYYGFTDLNSAANPEWDIVWSFTYALTGFTTGQHGFCTFLTATPLISAAIPGWYLGYLGHETGEPFIFTETPELLTDEDDDPLQYESIIPPTALSVIARAGIMAVAFDSTGFFALSDEQSDFPGVGFDSVVKNSLIIRDQFNQVIFNVALSTLNPNFILFSSTQKYYQTIRVRLINAATSLVVEFKPENDSSFQLLASISMTPAFIPYLSGRNLYTGFSYCSPLSSLTIDPSTLFLKNFSVQAISGATTFEIIPTTSILPTNLTYTSISGVRNL